jgi:hypothetical protein
LGEWRYGSGTEKKGRKKLRRKDRKGRIGERRETEMERELETYEGRKIEIAVKGRRDGRRKKETK